MNGFTIQPQFIYDERFIQFNQCRVIPKNDRIIVELQEIGILFFYINYEQ